MKITHALLLSLTMLSTVGCPSVPKPPPPTECIRLPESTDKREKELSAKLSADLLAGIGKPSLEATYKNKVDVAYAQLGQKSLEQLVLIEFLVCIKTHHSKDVSPETLASMERALQVAINRAAGVQGLAGGLTAASKRKLAETPYGSDKVSALSQLGL